MELSIIIAAYNVETFIEKCVRSCFEQNIPVNIFEIIVVNDGSIDLTTDILNRLKLEITNLRVIEQANAGLGSARNVGVQHATGEFIWMIDGDDYLQENILAEINNKIRVDNLDVLMLNYAITDIGYLSAKAGYTDNFLGDNIMTGSEYYKSHYNKSYTWQFIFKRSVFSDNGIIFKESINMQDSEILPKIMFHVTRLAFFKKISYYYVQQPNSFTNSPDGEKRYRYFQSIIIVKESLASSLLLNDEDIKIGITKKLKSLDEIIFNHIIFFKYEKKNFSKILALLRVNKLYPLRYEARGKMKFVKWGVNHLPFITKKTIDKIQHLRNGKCRFTGTY